MAIMFPEDQQIFAAESEREMYDLLRRELPDDVRVYYSISWNSDAVTKQFSGEGDFVVLDPNFGFLVLEVKGGYKIDFSYGQWTIWDTPTKSRPLSKSPYEQAKTSMYTFVGKYKEKYNEPIPVTYAFAVCFPHYNVDKDLSLEVSSSNTICLQDIQDGKLWECLRRVFFAHKVGGGSTEGATRKLDALFRGETSAKIPAANLIESNRRRFAEIGMVQTACVDMLWNYNQVMIVGSAGTGKTSIAIQKAMVCAADGLKTLYLCYNRLAAAATKKALIDANVDCMSFHRFVLSVVGENVYKVLSSEENLEGVLNAVTACAHPYYDAIIVDEAQDFTEEWALTIRALLKDDKESILYVFFDEEQNIFRRDFGEAFLIAGEPYLLRRNLRNTENIWSFVVDQTAMGNSSYSNGIVGLDPKCYPTKNRMKLIESITHLIRSLVSEGVPLSSIVILSDRKLIHTPLRMVTELAGNQIIDGSGQPRPDGQDGLAFYTVQSYKGMDSEVVICLLSTGCSKQMRYVAYSRARCLLYLYEFNPDHYQDLLVQ